MAALIPYLLVGGSYALNEKNNRDVERRQKQVADAMQGYQTDKSRQGEAATNKFLDTLTPEARAAQNLKAKQELQTGLEKSVAATQDYEKPDGNFSGKVSDAYTNRVASNKATTADRLKRAIDQISTIGTPATAGLNTQFRFGRAAGDVDFANAGSNRVGAAYRDQLSRVRPDARLAFISQLMLGAGLGSAGGTPMPKPKPRTGLYDFGPNVPGEDEF